MSMPKFEPGDLVEYVPNAKCSVPSRTGALGIVTRLEGDDVWVEPIFNPSPNSGPEWPYSFVPEVWRKIGKAEL